MPNFRKRSYEPELLDAENLPQKALYQNLRELEFINTYLGGHEVLKIGARSFKDVNTVLEIGSGGGDNLRALKNELGPHTEFIGVDLKKDCTHYAREHTYEPSIYFHTSDYKLYEPQKPIDLMFNSLFCHHFNDEQLIEMLRWMYQNSSKGFFIGDLHRHPLAYYSIKLLTQLFSKSYLVKNDAPLSVARGFTKQEWKNLLQAADIPHYKIQWKWAFRHLIVVKK